MADVVVLSDGGLASTLLCMKVKKEAEAEGIDLDTMLLYVSIGAESNNGVIAVSAISLRLDTPAAIYNDLHAYAQADPNNKLLVLIMAAARYGNHIYIGYTDEQKAKQAKEIESVLREMGNDITVHVPLVGKTYFDMAEEAYLMADDEWPIKTSLYCDSQDRGAAKPCGLCSRCYEKWSVMEELGISTEDYFENEIGGDSE